jgi:putative FmdB family regulatory protein
MPIYTYRCENCGIQFDRKQSFEDEPLKVCPECEKEALRKVYLPVGIVFKGSGFYATDNRSPSGGNGARGSSGESSSEKAQTSEKSDDASPSSSSKED